MTITKDMAHLNTDILDAVENTAHVLIAGTTGSGKSVLLNTILYNLIKRNPAPQNHIELALFDTKRVELKQFAKYHGTVRETEPENAPELFNSIISIMDERYENMEGKKTDEPPLYVVVDELADLVSYGPYAGQCLDSIIKIGRLGRAANVHLICCTQDPSRHTLSAQLMQNFTTRIALRCQFVIESRQIIGMDGAEKLPKYGKAIVFDSNGTRTINIPVVSDEDSVRLCETLNQRYDFWLEVIKKYKKTGKYDFSNEPDWLEPDIKDLVYSGKLEGVY